MADQPGNNVEAAMCSYLVPRGLAIILCVYLSCVSFLKLTAKMFCGSAWSVIA